MSRRSSPPHRLRRRAPLGKRSRRARARRRLPAGRRRLPSTGPATPGGLPRDRSQRASERRRDLRDPAARGRRSDPIATTTTEVARAIPRRTTRRTTDITATARATSTTETARVSVIRGDGDQQDTDHGKHNNGKHNGATKPKKDPPQKSNHSLGSGHGNGKKPDREHGQGAKHGKSERRAHSHSRSRR